MDHSFIYYSTHVAPIGLILASFVGLLPSVAALVAIIWYCILIFESETMKGWRTKRALKKLAKIEAERVALLGLLRIKGLVTPEDRADGVSDMLKPSDHSSH